MYTTKAIRNYGENELKLGVQSNSSWHQEYSESAYVFLSNIHYDMNEGDIAVVFSQFGEPIDVHLVRNKKTGKSRGFCFLAYNDQRSTSLAVDNMNGAEICGRIARVDHVKQFKPPKEYLELEQDDPEFFNKLYKPSGPDGKGWADFRQEDEEEKQLAERQKQVKKEKEERNEKILESMNELQQSKQIIDADERWEKMLMNDMENENDALQRKILELQKVNEKLVKKKEVDPKKKIATETNEEREQKLKKHIKKEEKSEKVGKKKHKK